MNSLLFFYIILIKLHIAPFFTFRISAYAISFIGLLLYMNIERTTDKENTENPAPVKITLILINPAPEEILSIACIRNQTGMTRKNYYENRHLLSSMNTC